MIDNFPSQFSRGFTLLVAGIPLSIGESVLYNILSARRHAISCCRDPDLAMMSEIGAAFSGRYSSDKF